MKRRLWVAILAIVGLTGFALYRSSTRDEIGGLTSLSPASTERKILEDEYSHKKYEIRKLTFNGASIQKSRQYLDAHLTTEKLKCVEQDDIFAVYKDPKSIEHGKEVYWFYMDESSPTAVVIERSPISEAKSKMTSAMQKISSQKPAPTPTTTSFVTRSSVVVSPSSRSTGDLNMAVSSNDLGGVKKALAAGGDPNKQVYVMDESAVLKACSKDDLTIARYLLDHGGKANTSANGEPIVSIVAARGYLEGARLLLEHGARLSKTDSQPLIECSETTSPNDDLNLLLDEAWMWIDGRRWRMADQAVKLLIDNGVPVNGREVVTKQTALHKAAECGHARIVKLLLEHDADPTIWDAEKKYPIDIARQSKRNNWRQVVELLQAATQKTPAK